MFVPGSVLVVCRVEVWHILFVLISLYSVFNLYVYSGLNPACCSCTTLIGYYISSALLLYVADFLLVNIYTLRNGLRDKELRVRISRIAADLALFNV